MNNQNDCVEIEAADGRKFIVDADVVEEISQYRWCIGKSSSKRSYVKAKDAGNRTIYLHRMIMRAKPGQLVDHKDGNPLDNRRANLRIATAQQNSVNKRSHLKSATGYRGVWRGPESFVASVRFHGKRVHCGKFKNAEDAARAYDKRARELHGEFAVLNFPESMETK